jgi:hypothetical protein
MQAAESVTLSPAERLWPLKPYQTQRVDEETGETVIESKYIYLQGRPREYRFNGQNGQFNLYGERILLDSMGKPLAQFSFQPIAYRIFEETLFVRKEREIWAEIFFVDADNCVSSLMFNNTSVSELYRMMEPLFYERRTLCDVVVTVKPEKVTSKSDPGKSWFIARFSYVLADEARIKELREFTKDHAIYRAETLTTTANHKLVSKYFNNVLLDVADRDDARRDDARPAVELPAAA